MKKIDYHLFDVVVEFHKFVFLLYLKRLTTFKDNLFVLYGGDEDLSNLVFICQEEDGRKPS